MKTLIIIYGPPRSGKTMIEDRLRPQLDETIQIRTQQEGPMPSELRALESEGWTVHVLESIPRN